MRICMPILMAMAAWLPLAAEQVHLKDGRVIEGEVSYSEEGQQVDIFVESGGVRGTFHFPVTEVLRIDLDPSRGAERVAAVWDAYRALVDPVAAEVWDLARRLDGLGEPLEFRAMAEEVLALDPDHAEARAALGFERFEGEWMKPHEVAEAKGLVRYAGRWMTTEERDAIERERAERRRRREEERLARLRLAAARRCTRAAPPALGYYHSYGRGYGYGGYGAWGYGWGGCTTTIVTADDDDGILVTRDGRVIGGGTVVTRDGRVLGGTGGGSTTVIERWCPVQPVYTPVLVPVATGLSAGFRYRDDHWAVGGTINFD